MLIRRVAKRLPEHLVDPFLRVYLLSLCVLIGVGYAVVTGLLIFAEPNWGRLGITVCVLGSALALCKEASVAINLREERAEHAEGWDA